MATTQTNINSAELPAETTYITNELMGDGLGSQFQHIISVILISLQENCKFVYNPIQRIQHNYMDDPHYIQKVEDLMNIRAFFPSIYDDAGIDEDTKQKIIYCGMDAKYHIDRNIDEYGRHLPFVREMFWENKMRASASAREQKKKIVVAAHIRRVNEIDKLLPVLEPERFSTSNDFYIETMQKIILEHRGGDGDDGGGCVLEFHIYSQGEVADFNDFLCIPNIFLHINGDVFETFVDLVSADILITSFSSFSYTAALLNENTVYYHRFWHSPLKHWILL